MLKILLKLNSLAKKNMQKFAKKKKDKVSNLRIIAAVVASARSVVEKPIVTDWDK